jgi:hypothetical protein
VCLCENRLLRWRQQQVQQQQQQPATHWQQLTLVELQLCANSSFY